MTFALYITHPQVQIEPDVPVPQWRLSDVGRSRVHRVLEHGWVQRLGRIVSSDETKAIETADLLAASTDIEFEIVTGLHENDRSATGFLKPADFEVAADWFFAHPQDSFQGWERAIEAQARIVAGIDAILATHDPAVPIAFVGHGGVGTLLKCHLRQRPISRSEDQPGGGGNLFCFTLADRAVSCDWTPIEFWHENPAGR